MNIRRYAHLRITSDGAGLVEDNNLTRVLFRLLLVAVVLVAMSPGFSAADGLFDFQMKLATRGNAEAQFKIGEMYKTGRGVKQDQEEAIKWFKKAVNKKHEKAGYKLLLIDAQKNGITAGNQAIFEKLKKAAAAGNHDAEYYIGKMYAGGIGVKQNYNTGIKWLNKAILAGVLEAENEMQQIRDKQEMSERTRAAKRKKAALEKEKKAKEAEQKRKQAVAKQQEDKRKKDEALKRKQAQADKKQQVEQAHRNAEEAESRAQNEAERRRKVELKAERARKRTALLKQRKKREQERESQFESDPCSGKSARFLSTCR